MRDFEQIRSEGRCEGRVHQGRPDRGPETECQNRARFLVLRWDRRVCGVHRRAYTWTAVEDLPGEVAA